MNAEITKPLVQSRTIWSAVVMLLAALAPRFGIELSPDEQQTLLDGILSVIDEVVILVAFAGVVFARIVADKRIRKLL